MCCLKSYLPNYVLTHDQCFIGYLFSLMVRLTCPRLGNGPAGLQRRSGGLVGGAFGLEPGDPTSISCLYFLPRQFHIGTLNRGSPPIRYQLYGQTILLTIHVKAGRSKLGLYTLIYIVVNYIWGRRVSC